jgi:hypothetical protein
VRLIAWGMMLGIVTTINPAGAQQQKTLGPCSPAIAGIKGNVTVTCITRDRRIRIARYDGIIDQDGCQKFGEFLEANAGQIIHLDTQLHGVNSAGFYCHAGFWRLKFKETENNSWQQSSYLAIDGYYVVEKDDATRWNDKAHKLPPTYSLRAVDDKEILLSDKYDTR